MDAALTLQTSSVEETERLAGQIAEGLGAGEIVALCGELGTGKTRFVAGACRALGYAGRVRSPSFTLLNIYRGRCLLYHFDLYRWDPQRGVAEVEEWSELWDGAGVSFIEWADRLGDDLPARAWVVWLSHRGQNERALRLSAPAGPLAALRGRLAERSEA